MICFACPVGLCLGSWVAPVVVGLYTSLAKRPRRLCAEHERSFVAMLRPTRSRLLLRPRCMLQHMARMGLRGRAHGTSAGSSGPALTQWGSLGATAEELDQIEEMARQDGENQAQLTLQLAEMGLKMYAMCTRPREWFGDAEWRAEFVEQMREPMATYARVNHRLLDGCEDAYRGVAEEFCAAEPNFDALVESGAMAPQLAALLQALTLTLTLILTLIICPATAHTIALLL